MASAAGDFGFVELWAPAAADRAMTVMASRNLRGPLHPEYGMSPPVRFDLNSPSGRHYIRAALICQRIIRAPQISHIGWLALKVSARAFHWPVGCFYPLNLRRKLAFAANDQQIVLPAAARMDAAPQPTIQKPPVFSGG
ncbi:MAG: hypothetical protein WCC59_19490 [Terriglobales bacterium]